MPCIVAYQYFSYIKQDVSYAATLAIFCMIGIHFVIRVWESLGLDLANRTAKFIKVLSLKLGKTRQDYLSGVVDRFRDVELKGLTNQGVFVLEVEKVFTELNIIPQSSRNDPVAPVHRLSSSTQFPNQTIWQFLTSKQASLQHFVILGPPGSGKTTLLKYIALTLATHSRKDSPKRLPILLLLRKHAEQIAAAMGFQGGEHIQDSVLLVNQELRQKLHHLDETELMSLVSDLGFDYSNLDGTNKNQRGMSLISSCKRKGKTELLQKELKKRDKTQKIENGDDDKFSLIDVVERDLLSWYGDTSLKPWLWQQLRRGRCLVMLDGLDEVADAEMRKLVVAWVDRQIALHKGNRFVITSRPFGYKSNPLSKVTILALQPFSRPQITDFVHKWYLVNEAMSRQRMDLGVRKFASKSAEDFLRRLDERSVLLELAVNPLLLTMIVTAHRYGDSLPERRIALYHQIFEVFLENWRRARNIRSGSSRKDMSILQPLAFHMMLNNESSMTSKEAEKVITETLATVYPEIAPSRFLNRVENNSGLLLERQPGEYEFAHKTFQEYLAAIHVFENRLEGVLVSRLTDSWWHETIRLYAAQVDATSLIKACLAVKPSNVKALTLAIDCEEEARSVDVNIRRKVAVLADSDNKEIRQTAAEAILRRRLRDLGDEKIDDKHIDTTLIKQAEYQIFLDQGNMQYKPSHWEGVRFPQGTALEPVVGVSPKAAIAFTQWLTKRENNNWMYRLPYDEAELAVKIFGNSTSSFANLGCWCQDKKGNISFAFVSKPSLRMHTPGVLKVDEYISKLQPSFSVNRSINLDFYRYEYCINLLDKALRQSVQYDFYPQDDYFARRRNRALTSVLRNRTSARGSAQQESLRAFASVLARIIDLKLNKDLFKVFDSDYEQTLKIACDISPETCDALTFRQVKLFIQALEWEKNPSNFLKNELYVFYLNVAAFILLLEEEITSCFENRLETPVTLRAKILKQFQQLRELGLVKSLSPERRVGDFFPDWQKEMNDIASLFLRVAEGSYILEERRRGLPALEGIRLVREKI